jgi:hypothetical protein
MGFQTAHTATTWFRTVVSSVTMPSPFRASNAVTSYTTWIVSPKKIGVGNRRESIPYSATSVPSL